MANPYDYTDPSQAPFVPQQRQTAVNRNPGGAGTPPPNPTATPPPVPFVPNRGALTPDSLTGGNPYTTLPGPSPVLAPGVPPQTQSPTTGGATPTGRTPAPTGPSAFDASQYYGKTDSASILSYVQGMLAGTGREGDAQMWANYITQKGGGPNSYWDNLIKTNQGGDAQGGLGRFFTGPNAQDQALRNALVSQLEAEANQSLNINPMTDPTIQMESAPYTAEQTRTARDLESQAAEAGGPNANLEATNRMIQEGAAQSSGAYSAGLVANELTARRDQIQQALTAEQGLLTADQQNQLQQQLAELNAAVSLQESQATANNQLQQAIYNNNYNLWYESRVNQGLPTS